MKILQISPRIPYPLTEGGNIGIFNITRQLSRRGAEVYFVASSNRPENAAPQALLDLCKEVLVVPRTKEYGVTTAFQNLFSDVPVNVEKYHSRKSLDRLIQMTAGRNFDLIHIDHLHMAYYGLALGKLMRIPVVLREHNLELKIMERFAGTSRNLFYRTYARLQAAKFRKYEPSICSQVDECIMITDEDRRRLLSYRNEINATVIPAGVDTETFKPMTDPGEEGTLAYAGSLDWLPNIEGLRWFVREVLPLIIQARPGVKFFVYGKNPSPDVFKLNDGRNVIVKGFVKDVREVFRQARVIVVPLRAGSGMRIKILEAMASGKPIVTTSVGSEGIRCEKGKNIMIEDQPEALARRIVELLGDPQLCMRIGRAASSFAANEYSWDKIGTMFWNEYTDIIARHQEQRQNG